MSQKRSLWDIALDQKRAQGNKVDQSDNQPCHSHVLVCGSKNSGKTSLIQRFLERDEAPKPTIALDFYYGRKSKQNNMTTVKDVTQIWELGGGSSMAKLTDAVISTSNIQNLKIVLLLDLSKPKTLWETQHTLLTQLNQKLNQVVKEMSKTNKQVEKELKQKAWLRVGENHKDKNMMAPFLLPLVIIGGKFDIFQQEFNSEERNMITKAVRFIAHSNGAMLQFFSSKAEGLGGRAKSVLSHLAFGTQLSKTTSIDASKPLIIPFGQDSFEQIGAPPVSSEMLLKLKRGGSPYELWGDAYNSVFQQEHEKKDSKTNPTLDQQFANDFVDNIRQQKDQELERYRKLCERKFKEAQLDANVGNVSSKQHRNKR